VAFGDPASFLSTYTGPKELQPNHPYKIRIRIFDFNTADENISFEDCVSIAEAQYQPNPNGFSFPNFGDPNVTYESMAADYPASKDDMYFLFGLFHTNKGDDFFDNVFKPQMGGGLCFGFSATSTYLFNDSPLEAAPPDLYTTVPTASSPWLLPFDGNNGVPVRSVLERFVSRQLAQLGAYEEFTVQHDKALSQGNIGVFDQAAAIVQQRPVVLIIFPRSNLALGKAHALVAYAAAVDGQGNKIISVYDPNYPGYGNIAFLIDPQGGVSENTGSYGYGVVNGVDWGTPQDWQLEVVPDFAWLDDSHEAVNNVEIDNRHWKLDAVGGTSFAFATNAVPSTYPQNPIFLSDAAPGSPVWAQDVPGGQSFSDRITTNESGATSGMFAANHVATVTQTDSAAAGTSHEMAIDSDATSVTLSDASSQQEYSVKLGADYLPNYGRKFTVAGDLAPSSTLTARTNAATDALVLAGSGASQTVDLTLAQIGQNASSATVPAVIPGSGTEATVSVTNWDDVQHSLIYETYMSGGQARLIVAQDNPAEHQALAGRFVGQLESAINGLSDKGLAQSLKAKLDAAKEQISKGQNNAARNILGALENQTRAQAGKKIPAGTATSILSNADLLIGLLQG
jgi:hypothetical protein